MKRHSFILAETVIAGVLTALLIGICCGALLIFQKMVHSAEKRVSKAQTSYRQEAYLRHVLTQIVRSKDDPFILEPPSGRQSERLIFVLDNGEHVNPKLHGLVLAMLYVDKEYGLVLVIRSHPSRKVLDQKEEHVSVIWPNVDHMSWKFALRSKDKNEKPGLNDTDWQTIWPKEWTGLPAVIQVTITEKGKQEPTEITSVVMNNLDYIAAKALTTQ